MPDVIYDTDRVGRNVEATKDFPHDYFHNRARGVCDDLIDKRLKSGAIRELKRAIANREASDARGADTGASKPFVPGLGRR